MKKLSIFAATAALSLTLATVASADTSSTSNMEQNNTSTEATTTQTENNPIRLTVSEPFVKASDLVIAPLPIDLEETTVIYEMPEGKAWSKLAPQSVTPTGKVQGEWFEIYTWLGNAWIHLPGHTLSFN
ncbi:hypothetical protein ABE099_19210 [Paenibacillus turicensis]|uniref:hypothetical protein n=1 Tax=Paenibacillus turicensis TaxID=160487 RepID=UPI003D29A610